MRRLAASLALCGALLAALQLPAEAGRSAGKRGVRDEVADAGASNVEAARNAARAALVERLNKLAGWCNDKELFVERDRIWRKVLEIAPDDATARKGLRYARNVDGSWKEPPPRKLENIGKKHLADLEKRETETYAPYGDALLDLARAETRTAAEREGLLAELREIAPNHAGMHAWLGNVQMGDRWVMPETVKAKERRATVRGVVKQILETSAPLAEAKPHASEEALGIAWKFVLQGENVRILSTASEEETARIGRAVEGVGELLRAALGGEMRYPGAYTIYVLAGPGEKETFLERLPGLDASDRTRMSGLEATGVPRSNNVAIFSKESPNRVDAAVRHTIGHVLALSIGVSHQAAWAWEGLGQYLTRELVGTRLTWFVSETADPATSDLRGRLMNPETNWIQEAYDLLASGSAVPLEELLRRELDQLGVPGTLTGYALIAYLLEGRPESVLTFVSRAARGDAPATISREVLALSPPELQERLVRWLSERR